MDSASSCGEMAQPGYVCAKRRERAADVVADRGTQRFGQEHLLRQQLQAYVLLFVNADEIASRLTFPNQEERYREAMRLAEQQRQALIAARQTFAAETVFSHPSKIDLIRQAKAAGHKVNLVFIATESPDINQARVEQRVQLGGHDVPAEKIAPRYERSLVNLRAALPLVDRAYLYDNSDLGQRHRLVLNVAQGRVQGMSQELPQWLERIFPEGVQAYLSAAQQAIRGE